MPVALHAADEAELVQRLTQLFVKGRDARRARYDYWYRNYRLVNNRMSTTGIANWMPSPRDSEIYPTFSAIVAWMTDNNVMVDAIPAADPHSPFYQVVENLANDLSAVLYTIWLVENYNRQLKMSLWDALTYGIGITKSIWDGDLDNGMGNAMLIRVDPWAFYVDPSATSTDDMEWCCEARRMSLDELERRYPNARTLMEATGTATINFDERPDLFRDQAGTQYANAGQLPGSGTYGDLGPNVVGNFGRPKQQRYKDRRGTVVVYEFWLRENEVWTDDYSDIPMDDRPDEETHVQSRWRMVVMAQGEILMDVYADELWTHGQHPYERFVYDDIGEFYGIALADHVAYPAIYINRLLTMMEFNAELCGNPIFVEAANSGTARIPIINKPGQRLQVTGAAAMQNRPDWLKPPDMPSQVMDLIEFWIQRIEATSGLSAITKGATPSQRNAEGVISSIQEAAFVRLRSAQSNYEKMLESQTAKLADIIIDNYTEKRIMAIIGPDGEKSAKTLFARHFYSPEDPEGETPLKFTIQIRAGAAAPTSRQSRINEADKLGALGIIDDQAVLEAHQYPNIQKLLTRKYDKMQKGLWTPPGARQRAGRQQ